MIIYCPPPVDGHLVLSGGRNCSFREPGRKDEKSLYVELAIFKVVLDVSLWKGSVSLIMDENGRIYNPLFLRQLIIGNLSKCEIFGLGASLIS
jgi:hypothetical protein